VRTKATFATSPAAADSRGSFDFLAAYLVYEDVWYIVPEEDVLGKKSISLATNCFEARYEQYREAWHLLEDKPDSGEAIDIQACVEEFPFDNFDEACQFESLNTYSLPIGGSS
jgi:hypothetical protein